MTQQNVNGATAKPTGSSGETTFLSADAALHGGTEIIPSVAIDRVIAERDEGMRFYQEGLQMIEAATAMLAKAAASDSLYYFEQAAADAIRWRGKPERNRKAMCRVTDVKIWDRLMSQTGMYTFMSARQRERWDKELEGENMPEITLENVLATFRGLHAGKQMTFEQGVIDVFRSLSWDFKTNNPCRMGKKIIISNLLDGRGRYGVSGMDRLNDLERAFCIIEGKTVPDYRNGAGSQFDAWFNAGRYGEPWAGDYFSVKAFMKGTGHVVFSRPDLVEQINDLVARHYPAMLASRM